MSRGAQRPGLDLAYGAASAGTLVALWWLVSVSKVVPHALLPSPSDLAHAAERAWASGLFLASLGASALRLLSGYGLGVVAGIGIGALIGSTATVRAIAFPVLESLRPIPPLAWIPLAIIWFGIGEESKLFLIALMVAFTVALATVRGIAAIDPIIIRAARSLDVTPWRMMVSILIPGAMPDIATSLRLAWSLAIAVLVGAEMIAASSGIGYMIMDGMNLGQFDTVLLGILTLGVLSALTDALFRVAIDRKLLHWHTGLEDAAG